MAKAVGVTEGVVAFLLEEEGPCQRLLPYVKIVTPGRSPDSLEVTAPAKEALSGLLAFWKEGVPHGVAAFAGAPGTGKRAAAEAVCAAGGFGLLWIDGTAVVASREEPKELIGELHREVRLRNAVLYWSGADALWAEGEGAQAWRRALLGRVAEWGCPIVLAGTPGCADALLAEEVPVIRIEFGIPPYEDRRAIWEKALLRAGESVDRAVVSALAGRFRLTAGQIHRIVASARATMRVHRGSEPIATETLWESCRAFSRNRLVNLATKVQPRRSWADLVLSRDRIEILREISSYVKHQAQVLEEWGFGRKLALSSGLNVLFVGPSGTGKSLAAEILASDLGLDLYRIDLATVVSKYVGETEKNLDRIFVEAEHSNAILFFDEADAIFGKRSEIRDSHDRYANVEISYLLQKMEAYDGIAILATNLRKNLDEAFLRRMHFTVEFPMPEEEDRLRIWRLCFPPDAPVADDVDFGFLARRFRLPEGSIKSIAVAAAFQAAEHATPITMASMVHGIRREFQKMGKLVVDSDFPGFERLLAAEDA